MRRITVSITDQHDRILEKVGKDCDMNKSELVRAILSFVLKKTFFIKELRDRRQLCSRDLKGLIPQEQEV